MKWIFFYISIAFLFLQCSNKQQQTDFYKGVHWQIISFEDTVKNFRINDWLWLDAEFLNEKDSVFWNSHHEGADKFFIQLKDTSGNPFFYPFYLASEQDSIKINVPKTILLKSIFNLQQCPPFLKDDSTITGYFKIRKKINPSESIDFIEFRKDEEGQIQNFLKKHQPLNEKDTNGIIWLEPLPIPAFKQGREYIKEATVAYTGYFLDGRMIDHCDSLGIHYNDTLQLIEGLNYVIKKLDVGQSAKIILPSHLAFGMRGSFNKTIPPFTPMLYEIKLIQIQ